MPVYLDKVTVIFNKKAIQKKYKGGYLAFYNEHIYKCIEPILYSFTQCRKIEPPKTMARKYAIDRLLKKLPTEILLQESFPWYESKYLVALITMGGVDEYFFNDFVEKGLSVDWDKPFSDDFTIFSSFEGMIWKPSWLKNNAYMAWHPNESRKERNAFSKSYNNLYQFDPTPYYRPVKKNKNSFMEDFSDIDSSTLPPSDVNGNELPPPF